MRTLTLTFFVVILQLVCCAYEPWVEIKKWYSHMEYDREGAEARHAEFENSCFKAHRNATNGSICFDECMFRTAYRLVYIGPLNGPTIYGSNAGRGEDYLEKEFLRLKIGDHLSKHNQQLHESLRERLRRCAKVQPSFIMPHKASVIWNVNHEDGSNNLCNIVLNDKKKSKMMTSLVNCMKEEIKKPKPKNLEKSGLHNNKQ